MKIQEDPLCPACREQEEAYPTPWGECCANMQIRCSTFGAHLMQPTKLHKVESSTFAIRKSHKEVFVTFGCNRDVHRAECFIGLSTEWLTAARQRRDERCTEREQVGLITRSMTTLLCNS